MSARSKIAARSKLVALTGIFGSIGLLAGPSEAVAYGSGGTPDGCKHVIGMFKAQTVPPQECASPVGLCTEGRLYGNLKRSYYLTMNPVMPTPEADVPDVFFFTGTSEVTTHKGEHLVGIDTGSVNLSPPPVLNSGKFSTLLSFTDGADGHLWIHGTLDLATGEVIGTYSGEVCGS